MSVRPDLVECWVFRVPADRSEPEVLLLRRAPGRIFAGLWQCVTGGIEPEQALVEQHVDRIAPRPLLLLHSAKDSVTPTEQSIDLFQIAGQPTDLHLVAGIDHFSFDDSNPQLVSLLKSWLDKHLPLA